MAWSDFAGLLWDGVPVCTAQTCGINDSFCDQAFLHHGRNKIGERTPVCRISPLESTSHKFSTRHYPDLGKTRQTHNASQRAQSILDRSSKQRATYKSYHGAVYLPNHQRTSPIHQHTHDGQDQTPARYASLRRSSPFASYQRAS